MTLRRDFFFAIYHHLYTFVIHYTRRFSFGSPSQLQSNTSAQSRTRQCVQQSILSFLYVVAFVTFCSFADAQSYSGHSNISSASGARSFGACFLHHARWRGRGLFVQACKTRMGAFLLLDDCFYRFDPRVVRRLLDVDTGRHGVTDNDCPGVIRCCCSDRLYIRTIELDMLRYLTSSVSICVTTVPLLVCVVGSASNV